SRRSLRRPPSSARVAPSPAGSAVRPPSGDDPYPTLARKRGKGRSEAVGTSHDILQVPIEDVFLAVSQCQELLPGSSKIRLGQVVAELAQAELEGVAAGTGREHDPALSHPHVFGPHDLVVQLVFEDAILVNAR